MTAAAWLGRACMCLVKRGSRQAPVVKLRLNAPPAAQRLLHVQLRAPSLQLLQLPRSRAVADCSMINSCSWHAVIASAAI